MTKTLVELEDDHRGFYVPAYEILVDNQNLLTDLFMEISSVQVDNVLKGGDRFSFIVNSTFNFEKKDFEHLQDTFASGNAVEISMGYQNSKPQPPDTKALRVMIMGKITGVQTSFRARPRSRCRSSPMPLHAAAPKPHRAASPGRDPAPCSRRSGAGSRRPAAASTSPIGRSRRERRCRRRSPRR